MKTFRTAALLSFLWLGAAPLDAQVERDERGREDDPVEVLLELRRELHLTREQVTTMRGIQRRLEIANRALAQQVFEIQRQLRPSLVGFGVDSGGGTRRPSPSQLAAARVPMQKIRENNLAAMEEVNAVLTPDQKRRAAVLLQMGERLDRGRLDWMRWRRERDRD